MPGLILITGVCISLLIVGSELIPVYGVFKALSWGEWPPMLERFLGVSKARLISAIPHLPYAIAAVIAGLIESIYWRSGQIWRGYHRSLWQLSLVPIILALAILISWVIALYEPDRGRLWIVCGLLIPAAFALSAGYKVSSTR